MSTNPVPSLAARGRFVTDRAETVMPPAGYQWSMAERDHESDREDDHGAVTKASFERQVGLFSGDDSVFARSASGPLAWLGPLDPTLIVLDVACGAAHVAEQVAPHVRQVVGVDLTPALLELGADRLRAAGVGNVLLQV